MKLDIIILYNSYVLYKMFIGVCLELVGPHDPTLIVSYVIAM